MKSFRYVAILMFAALIFEFLYHAFFPTGARLAVLQLLPSGIQKAYIGYVLSTEDAYFSRGIQKLNTFKVLDHATRKSVSLSFEKSLLIPYLSNQLFFDRLNNVNTEEHVSNVIEDIILRSGDESLLELAFSSGSDDYEITYDLCARARKIRASENLDSEVVERNCELN